MYNKLPELLPEEKRMPLARFYYDYPVRDLSEDLKALIFGAPVSSDSVIPAERFTDWLKPCGVYEAHENAYCMMPDGSGYIATYLKFPKTVEPQKLFWYLQWLNFHGKSQPAGTGNLRYKIWNPADHWDHYFINWTDKSEGIHTTESLDLGEGERKYDTIRHPFSLRQYGLTQERIDEIAASGAGISDVSDWESFDTPGAHLTLGQIRPCPDGGFERRSVEWIGWRPKDGKIIRVPETPCDEAYLRKVAYHTLLEWQHICDLIDDLYAFYRDKPLDAD